MWRGPVWKMAFRERYSSYVIGPGVLMGIVFWDSVVYSGKFCLHSMMGQGRRSRMESSSCASHTIILFPGPLSTRMPLRTSLRKRARSGAPPCDLYFLWTPPPPPALSLSRALHPGRASPLRFCAGIHSEGDLSKLTSAHPPLTWHQLRSQFRLSPCWTLAMALGCQGWGVSPTQFNSKKLPKNCG